jgi:uncharacterized protein YbjT (DUF2867 family)
VTLGVPAPAPERLLVLGANGPTGRQVVRQALERGHRVWASTRDPDAFPDLRDRANRTGFLQLVIGDATDPDVIGDAVRSTDAVICTIGTKFTRKPVRLYSATARALVATMSLHDRRPLVVVTSASVGPSAGRRGLLDTVGHMLLRRVLGRTLYDDMERMEDLVRASDLDWTIVHPPGLVDAPGRGYASAPGQVTGPLCAREDLAAMLLDQLADRRASRTVMAVATPGLRVSATYMLRHEVLGW